MGLLDTLYSRLDAAKRIGGGLLSNPGDTLQQWLAQTAEDVKARTGLLSQGYDNAQSVMPGVAQAGAQQQLEAAGHGMFAPVTVYHGSPHLFDKFDMSKIGTGEGAQAYGHGLYFADTPEVARSYIAANASGGRASALFDGKPVSEIPNKSGVLDWLDSYGSIANTRAALKGRRDDVLAELDKLVASGRLKEPGALYRVDIPDEAIDKMLHWDKPLSEQPQAVQKALAPFAGTPQIKDGMALAGGGNLRVVNDPDFGAKYFLEMGGSRHRLSPADVQNLVGSGVEGKSAYQNLATALGGDVAASNFLKQAGIPGIKYLDQGSRAAKDGTHNYVLFDDALVKILERNGKPLGL